MNFDSKICQPIRKRVFKIILKTSQRVGSINAYRFILLYVGISALEFSTWCLSIASSIVFHDLTLISWTFAFKLRIIVVSLYLDLRNPTAWSWILTEPKLPLIRIESAFLNNVIFCELHNYNVSILSLVTWFVTLWNDQYLMEVRPISSFDKFWDLTDPS